MLTGLGAGITWGIETIIVGLALVKGAFISTEQAIFLAPFISTFLHDGCSALWMVLFNGAKGELKQVWHTLVKTTHGKYIVLGAVVGGPVGMTGYMLCVTYLGASIGAVASAVYPAIGAVFAHIFLKERMKWYRWVFLMISLGGVFMLSYSPELQITNFALGVAGALMYSIGMSAENVLLSNVLQQPDIPFNHVLQIRQTTSALVTGGVLITAFKGWKLTGDIIFRNVDNILVTVAIAAFFGTVSFLLFSLALMKIGVAKTLAVNGTYCAWAVFFSAIFLKDTSALNPVTIISAVIVVVFGILTATEYSELFRKQNKT